MARKNKPKDGKKADKDSGAMKVLGWVRIAPGKFRVTTQSRKYGKVSRPVFVFPASVAIPDDASQHEPETSAAT
jgi:hypothetical protein